MGSPLDDRLQPPVLSRAGPVADCTPHVLARKVRCAACGGPIGATRARIGYYLRFFDFFWRFSKSLISLPSLFSFLFLSMAAFLSVLDAAYSASFLSLK
jgi:hypothetical protein